MRSHVTIVVVDRLQQMLEDVEVCSAKWRRSAQREMLGLTGDEHSHRKEEFDKRRKQNEEIRDKILSHILRLQESGPRSVGPSAGTALNLVQINLSSDSEAYVEEH